MATTQGRPVVAPVLLVLLAQRVTSVAKAISSKMATVSAARKASELSGAYDSSEECCISGTFGDQIDNQNGCKSCDVNYYQPQSSQPICLACLPNLITLEQGAHSEGQCISSNGYYKVCLTAGVGCASTVKHWYLANCYIDHHTLVLAIAVV